MATTPLNSDRLRQQFKSEFLPDTSKKPEERIAAAIEYTAFQLGQLNKKLGQVLASMEQLVVRPATEGSSQGPSVATSGKPTTASANRNDRGNEW